ncbi:MAG: pilus assembly protein PilP [Desulfuromonadaceae bacterium]|nr:pilus assembly protein PilP [Desulfuromonadaceae bacterium]MDD2847862.1 pilus assembly protein PilP [Desulfuromonadaceae bacterium]MDD4129593.1 pilus assembly protein PilP [Desulfuromonadaceae bacterium]
MIKKLLLKNSLKSTTQNGSSALVELCSALKTQNISSNIRTVSIVFVCALMISACKKNQDQAPAATPVKPPMVAIPQRTVAVQRAVSSVLRVPPAASNQFDFSNKKDPFKPFVAVKSEPLNTADAIKKAKRNSLPIHSFDVGQFKLIGVITGGRENRAMVTDPGGKGYVLKVGMLIGKNDGKVVSITSNGVDILEQFRDDSGRIRKENIKLTLPRKQ